MGITNAEFKADFLIDFFPNSGGNGSCHLAAGMVPAT
jgi:hypothetical protein